MTIAVSLAILAASIAALMAGIWLVRHFGQRLGWPPEVQRKCVHVAIGLYALTLPLLFHEKWPVVVLIVAALALMLFLRTPPMRTAGMGAAIHSVERRSAGDIWLALAIGFVFLRAGNSYILYALPIAVIALSDAAAALTGTAYGKRRFAIEDGVKSYEGMVAFFAVTWILSMVMLLLLSDVPRINVVVLGLAIAGFGATVEAASWRGLDNLFVPICVQFFLAGYLNATPEALGIIALVFAIAVLAVALLTPLLGLSVHASRAFVIAIFLFLGAGGVHGAVLPVLVMAAHLLARTRRPCCSEHGDLDFIAALCATGLIWYFVGSTVGPNAINFYNLAVGGMLLGYLIIVFGRWWAVPAAVLVFALYVWLVAMSPDYSRWASGLGWLGIGSLGLVLVALAVRPAWFDRWRGPRVAMLAGAVPMAAYLILAKGL
jgi:dolichol kinase